MWWSTKAQVVKGLEEEEEEEETKRKNNVCVWSRSVGMESIFTGSAERTHTEFKARWGQ